MKHLKVYEDFDNSIRKDVIYHVGYMDISKKRDGYEGSGLSVSEHPNEWEKINKLTTGDLNVLTKKYSKFLDYYTLTDSYKNKVVKWGIVNSYIENIETYTVSWYDDEYEDTMSMVFDNLEEANEEAESYDTEVETNSGLKATEKLKNISIQKSIDISSSFDILLTIYLESETDYDGVWWNEILDIGLLSAPRGVIFNSKLKEWKIEKL